MWKKRQTDNFTDMTNTRIIDALEGCKKVLIDEISKYLERDNDKKVKCDITIPTYSYDTYSLEGYWKPLVVKSLYLSEEDNKVMIVYADGNDDFDVRLGDFFTTSEIINILDGLN